MNEKDLKVSAKTQGDEKITELEFFVATDEIEKKIESELGTNLDYAGKPEYTGVLYTCVKEVITNATKANMKRILFEQNRIDMDNEETYIKGMIQFKDNLTEKNYSGFYDELKRKNYWVKLYCLSSPKGVRLEVINNVHVTKIEDRRLREKLKKAMKYEDIVQFYMEQGDEIEGAGMGIALIVILLKGIGLDPSYFRIGNTSDGYTIARMEIPLSPDFQSLRDELPE